HCLPRAIGFTASLCSMGLPPALLGLNALTQKDYDFILTQYINFEEDLKDALKFYNPDQPFVPKVIDSKLKEKYQFTTITAELGKLAKKVQDLKIHDYEKKLGEIEKEINSAENSYNKKLAEIAELKKKIKSNQKNDLLDDTLKNCQSIIELVRSIKKLDLEAKYSTILIQTKKAIEERRDFEEKQVGLKKELIQLEKEIKSSLKRMDIVKAGDIIEKSKIFLVELVDDKVKVNWNEIEKGFKLTKDLISNVKLRIMRKSGNSSFTNTRIFEI
ncbi:unnamed protein product, partial [marine sediment metagenome]